MIKRQTPIERIDACAELNALGVTFEPAGDGEVAVCCPVHEDTKPSVQLHLGKNLWKCHAAGCEAKGDIVTFICHVSKKSREQVLKELSKKYALDVDKTLNPALVEKWHQKIWEAGRLLEELRHRGVTDEMIRKARLGFNDGRITIPVFDTAGNVLNVRKYLPGAPGPQKMRNTRGYSKPRLYQEEQVKFERVWICAGEMKALVAGFHLNPLGIGAVAVTAGEGAWDYEFTEKLKDKRVYICMDIDLGGQGAARKIAKKLCYMAHSVKVINLPLSKEQHPKGDLNDWVRVAKPSEEDWVGLMEESAQFVPPNEDDEDDDTEVLEVSLREAAGSEHVGRRVTLEAVCSQMDDSPYLVPKVVGVSCDKAQENCHQCPVRPKEPDPKTSMVEMTIKGTSPGVLNVINSPETMQRQAVMKALGIPKCKVVEFTTKSFYAVMDVRLNPQLQTGGDNRDHTVQPAYIVGEEVDLNTPYVLSGRVWPHPATQQSVLLLDQVEQGKDSLTQFDPDDTELDVLRHFQPKEWTVTSLNDKLEERHRDMEANVTRIYDRFALHMLIDLTYHSPLYLPFDGRVKNGWLNTLVVGDSSQGKSETSLRMMEHYGLGERVDCKNATSAGLLGGLQQIGKRWFVSWGVIPTHDKRLVICEEVKGMQPFEIGKLTDMRSSGTAELPKIEKRRAHARTRLIFISNPRGNKPMDEFSFGIQAIESLIGGLEDIRRFDAALVVSSRDVSKERLLKLRQDGLDFPHTHTSELSRLLMLWTWTRSPDNIRFEADAEALCLSLSVEMCKSFSEAIPLVDSGTMDLKLARLAASCAAMTFSTSDDDLQTLCVRECHVRWVFQWLMGCYSSQAFGYLDFTEAYKYADQLIDPKVVRRQLLGTKYPRDLVENLLHQHEISMIDLQDWCELDRDESKTLLSLLVRKHALRRDNRAVYAKTRGFIELLRQMRTENMPNEGKEQDHEKY